MKFYQQYERQVDICPVIFWKVYAIIRRYFWNLRKGYWTRIIGIENCRVRLMTFNRRQIILITLWSKENAQIYEQQQKKLEYLNGNS